MSVVRRHAFDNAKIRFDVLLIVQSA